MADQEKTSNTDGRSQPDELPAFLELLQDLDASEALIEMLGKPFIEALISVKRHELQRASEDINPWERKFLGSLV